MKTLITVTSIVFLSACASKPPLAGAERIYVSHQEPPADCHFVGEVQGAQGNFWTAEFTQDRNLLTGARNEMRNQALSLGANYVMIESESNSHNTAGHSLGGTYASVVFGNAYICPEKVPGNV